ncbi:MAG: hypothetical protein E6R05_02270 [Candidatus Moraniibacteriota bacterium]|nr:MAG: hypothetical protein E6R05_02270 [Candidatus Moranbacteria bacterium]
MSLSDLIATVSPSKLAEDLSPESRHIWYLTTALGLGAISAMASLLGDDERKLTWRIVTAYLLSGGLASIGLVLVLVEWYGFSYFLVGVAIFAGYKAFDVLAIASWSVTKVVRKVIGETNRKN